MIQFLIILSPAIGTGIMLLGICLTELIRRESRSITEERVSSRSIIDWEKRKGFWQKLKGRW